MSLKYKIEATRTDDYIIEINSLIWTEKELKDWSKTFSDIDSTEDLAEILSVSMMKYGTGPGKVSFETGNISEYH